jgi:hypothetical protein
MRIGDHIGIRRNMAPWWASPEFGEAEDLMIESVRDCHKNPLTFDEFLANISCNIGQYLITCYSQKLRSIRPIFLNDCKIESYFIDADGIHFVDEASPIVAYGLSFGFVVRDKWVNRCEQSGPSIEDRLRFVEDVGRARTLIKPHQRDQHLIRPNIELAKVIQ